MLVIIRGSSLHWRQNMCPLYVAEHIHIRGMTSWVTADWRMYLCKYRTSSMNSIKRNWGKVSTMHLQSSQKCGRCSIVFVLPPPAPPLYFGVSLTYITGSLLANMSIYATMPCLCEMLCDDHRAFWAQHESHQQWQKFYAASSL